MQNFKLPNYMLPIQNLWSTHTHFAFHSYTDPLIHTCFFTATQIHSYTLAFLQLHRSTHTHLLFYSYIVGAYKILLYPKSMLSTCMLYWLPVSFQYDRGSLLHYLLPARESNRESLAPHEYTSSVALNSSSPGEPCEWLTVTAHPVTIRKALNR